MFRYSSLLGKRVEVHYRAGDIYLSATGSLVSDSGKSISIEERYGKLDSAKTMRLQIPYQCVVRCTVPGGGGLDGSSRDLIQKNS